MTRGATYRALVVDDEPLVRDLTVRALAEQGFTCDAAGDGLEAQERLKGPPYDVVVTDLRMPNRHGHSLACELGSPDDHPVVVVLTGVAEPRLATDLIARGVEHVEFKPVDYRLFAAKIKGLAMRRSKRAGAENGGPREPGPAAAEPDAGVQREEIFGDIDRRLGQLSKLLPVSQAAFEVFNMTNSSEYAACQIAAAVARDASLAAEVLRLANSSFYNPAGAKVMDLEEAVVRIGVKRVGEFALATTALAALTASVLPWMNVDLAWRQSVTAGVAADLLLADRASGGAESGLFLSAIMHPLGRIVLGMLYPQQYQELVQTCESHNKTLVEEEGRVFPLNHGEVMARLLKAWKIPSAVYQPLKCFTEPYSSIARLAEPRRTKTEMVKLAVLVGGIAIGEWQPWDCLEFPPAAVLKRLGLSSFAKLIRETRSDAEQIVRFQCQAAARPSVQGHEKPREPTHQIAYQNLSPEPFDFLAETVTTMGIRLATRGSDEFQSLGNVLFNCLGAAPERVKASIHACHARSERLIVADAEHAELYSRLGRVVAMPASYAALRTACLDAAQECAGTLAAAT